MKIVWIIDNKFRELYGLYDLRENLAKHNIRLYLFYIPLWKTALDLINPNIVLVPNLYSNSCGPIVEYAERKKIDVFMHSSEGMYYTNDIQKQKYPAPMLKKLKKILVWGDLDSKYLIKKGFKKKIIFSGCLKFDKKNYSLKKKSNKKIKVIGIPTHLRSISSSGISKSIIPQLIRKFTIKGDFERLGLLKFEFEYIEVITKIIERIKHKYEVVFKVSPFEDPKIYKKTFPQQKIYTSNDVRDFLMNVDVILNVYSSVSVDALKFNVPVISLNKLVKWDEVVLEKKNVGPNAKHGSVRLGIEPNNLNELTLLLKKDKNYLINLCKKKNFFKKANQLAGSFDSLGIFTKLFINYKANSKKRRSNYIMYIKYLLVEFKQLLIGRPRPANFKRWRLSDQNLLKLFRLPH